MMRRLHPAEVALVGLTIAPVAMLSELLAASRRLNTSMSWSGEPSQEQILTMALNQLAYLLGPVLGTVSGAAGLGLVLSWCLAPSRQRSTRSTRTTSAAGSTRNRAATNMPNSSPSISNSSGAASISMSTERPRE